MGAAHALYHDVDGAPFRIGVEVVVTSLTDETGDAAFLGKVGVIVYYEYDCGCGQTYPDDPMIGVRFGDEHEEFWKEELSLAPVSSAPSISKHCKESAA